MLIFDLAEAINIGVGAVTGDVSASLKDRVADAATRMAIVRGLSNVLKSASEFDEASRHELIRLVKDSDVLRFIVEGGEAAPLSPVVDAWEKQLKRHPAHMVKVLQERLAEAGINAILSRLPLSDRALLVRVDQLRRALERTQTAAQADEMKIELGLRLGDLTTHVERLAADADRSAAARVSVRDRVAHYRDRVIAPLAVDVLFDRDVELAEMASFARTRHADSWLWWVAEPWAGKTALMAYFATHPPAGVRVASVFIIGRQIADADSNSFYAHLIPQLADIAGMTTCDLPDDLSGRMVQLDRMLRLAAASAALAGEELLLLIDGLDEDGGALGALPTKKQSLAASSPAILPPNAHVVLASRGNPPLPVDVGNNHPLRSAQQRALHTAPAATAAREQAITEINAILDATDAQGTRYGREVLAFMAASGVALTVRDLADLTAETPYTIERLLTGATGRSFIVAVDECDQEAYSLGHDMLDEAVVTKHLDDAVPAPLSGTHISAEEHTADQIRYKNGRFAALHPWRRRLANRAQAWADRGWPDGTPAYLTKGALLTLLSADPILQEQAVTVVTDPARIERLNVLHHGTSAAIAELRDVARALVGNWDTADSSLWRLYRALRALDQIKTGSEHVPTGLPALFASLGITRSALGLARAFPAAKDRSRELAGVATALVAAGKDVDALNAAYEARTATHGITDGASRDGALIYTAVALTSAGAEAIAVSDARNIADVAHRAEALAAVATALAQGGDSAQAYALVHEARTAARDVRDGAHRAEALTWVAAAFVFAGSTTDARATAEEASITAQEVRHSGRFVHDILDEFAAALVESRDALTASAVAQDIVRRRHTQRVVRMIARADATAPAPETLTTARRALAAGRSMTGLDKRGEALARAATALARAGDSTNAIEAARDIPLGAERCQALADVASILSGQGHTRMATTAAYEAVTTAHTVHNSHGRAGALTELGLALADEGDTVNALAAAHEALAVARNVRYGENRASILHRVASALARAGDSAAALAAAHEALAATHDFEDSDDRAWMRAQIVIVFAEAGESAHALAAARTFMLSSDRNCALRGVARALARQGDSIAALATVREIDDNAARSKALSDIGSALVEAGDAAAAITAAWEALDAAHAIPDIGSRQGAIADSAMLFARAGDTGAALTTAREVLDATPATTGHAGNPSVMTTVAAAFARAGDAATALSIAGAALSTVRDVTKENGLSESLAFVAPAYAHAGDTVTALAIVRDALNEANGARLASHARSPFHAIASALQEIAECHASRAAESLDIAPLLAASWIAAENPWLGWRSLPTLARDATARIVASELQEECSPDARQVAEVLGEPPGIRGVRRPHRA